MNPGGFAARAGLLGCAEGMRERSDFPDPEPGHPSASARHESRARSEQPRVPGRPRDVPSARRQTTLRCEDLVRGGRVRG
jgi:hypothetical protein